MLIVKDGAVRNCAVVPDGQPEDHDCGDERPQAEGREAEQIEPEAKVGYRRRKPQQYHPAGVAIFGSEGYGAHTEQRDGNSEQENGHGSLPN